MAQLKEEMWNTEPWLPLCQRPELAGSAGIQCQEPFWGRTWDVRLQQCNELGADSRSNPFFPKKTWRERATYKSRNPPGIRKRRKEPAQLISRLLCWNFTHISCANSRVCAEQTGKEEGAEDELKVTQNQLNQFHVSSEVGMNCACVLDSKLEMSLPYLMR